MTSIQGILQTKNYADFIILSDTGQKLHEFSGNKLANKCLPGDHVKWNDIESKCEIELRDEHPPLVGTLELTNKSKYGLTSRGIPIYLFTPYDKKYPHFIIGSSEKDIKSNKIAVIKFDEWKDNSTFPRGQLQQIIGKSGDYEAEKHALIWQASPWKYPKGEWKVATKETHERTKIEGGITFNIDPAGCKDIDDVLTFEKVDEGWRITITISDVARYVEDSSVEDIFASLIGQTLYMDGVVIRPMLPEEYSERTCSLSPNKTSYGISLAFIWTGVELKGLKWFESELINNVSYTYEACQESQQLSEPHINALKECASFMAGDELNDSHKWIEECMKFYNVEAAKLLKSVNKGVLRRHSKPNIEKLERYKKYIPELEMLAHSSAEYCLSEESDTIHHGLNEKYYTHATSPIRRYADLLNQRVLKMIIQNKEEDYIIPIAMYDMNKRQKVIKQFERDYVFLKAIFSADDNDSNNQNKNKFIGIIVDKIHVLDSDYVELHIWVKEWKRMIKSKYKRIDTDNILSADEKNIINVADYNEVYVRCAFNPNNRNWKERAIFNISNITKTT
jgi:exoribonuclease R